MSLAYRSTRDISGATLTPSQAILQGLAPDGGLYVPTTFPTLDLDWAEYATLSYQTIAERVLQVFLPDFTTEEIHACVQAAYDDKFDTPAIAPLTKHGDDYYLELFHGPTLAFKDLALTLLPHLMTTAATKNLFDQQIVILTATSGDTGKAAMAGFADVPGTQIIVFYPQDGVSPIQKQQMITQTGANTHVVAIKGNFDDAQTNVKTIFNDPRFHQRLATAGFQLSSANSINIGRLIPQVAYYIAAYAHLVQTHAIGAGDPINVSVPTGNFGDILAGYYAKRLGLPINQLICASNDNQVLTDFFNTGVYDRNRPFYTTTSPSMDILVSSNLERLLFYLTDQNAAQTASYMHDLETTGRYQITTDELARLNVSFTAGSANQTAVNDAIYDVFNTTHFAIDPHTAVARSVANQYRDQTGDQTPMMIVATASPYKFPQTVLAAISDHSVALDGLAAVTALHDKINVPIPPAIEQLRTAPIRHRQTIQLDAMLATIATILNLS